MLVMLVLVTRTVTLNSRYENTFKKSITLLCLLTSAEFQHKNLFVMMWLLQKKTSSSLFNTLR